MDFSFVLKASGIVFRESLEAVLVYGIIVSFFQRIATAKKEVRAAKLGLIVGGIASVVLGMAFAGVTPLISERAFSFIEIFIIFGGSLLMLYMVFWMSQHAKSMKKDLEADLSRAVGLHSLSSIFGTVFVAVFREGVETVIYLYSLSLEKSGLAHWSSVALSMAIGVSVALAIYFLLINGSKRLSMRVVFRITSIWLLCSSSALMATGLDKVFSAGFFEKLSQPMFAINLPGMFAAIGERMESIFGLRWQPSLLHLLVFLSFWCFVVYKDPLEFRRT